MKKKFIFFTVCAAMFFVTVFIVSCDNLGTINKLIGGINYSIQVNNVQGISRNHSVTRSSNLTAEDTVELFIMTLEYARDHGRQSLFLVSPGHRTVHGSDGNHFLLDNAGWFNITETNIPISNRREDMHIGKYSSVLVRITHIRIGGENGTVYEFPNEGNSVLNISAEGGVIFGRPTPDSTLYHFQSDYPDNFSGMRFTTQSTSIRTIISVHSGIIGTPGSPGHDAHGLSTNPYQYITIEVIVE